MNRRPKKWIIISLAVTMFMLCLIWILDPFGSKSPLDSNTNEVQLKLEINNLKGTDLISDTALFNQYLSEESEVLELLTNNYKTYNSLDTSIIQVWKSYFAQDYVKETEKEIRNVFKSYVQESSEIVEAFKRLKHHFPEKEYPKKIILTNTNFGGNVYLENGTIIVGTERYIGGNKKVIQNSLPPDAFPQWLKSGFEKKYLLRDLLMSTLIYNNTIPDSEQEFLISKIIEWGKICVITEMALRLGNEDIKPEILLRWSVDQYNWAEKNEKALWKYLKTNKLLFSSNEKDHAFILNNGPYTIGFSEQSPDRLGQYLGWKMVRNYIFEEEIALSEIVKLDYKTILKKYNP